MPQLSRRAFAGALPLGLIGEASSVEACSATPPPVRRRRKLPKRLLR